MHSKSWTKRSDPEILGTDEIIATPSKTKSSIFYYKTLTVVTQCDLYLGASEAEASPRFYCNYCSKITRSVRYYEK